MKTNSITPTAMTILAFLMGTSSAFHGQLRLDEVCSEGCNTVLNLVDYNTGSTYFCGGASPAFCTFEGRCPVL